jgi:hypothetical protein
MNSQERHEARFQRRKAKRLADKSLKTAEFDKLENICSCNALYKAARESRKSIRWKASTQRYYMNLLPNIIETHDKILSGKNITQGFIEFTLCERGKVRHIKSVHFKERVVQRSLCDNALVPMLRRTLIYDNGASLQGKGILFAHKRLKTQLHQYYRKNGFSNDGYILLLDFKSYFDSIQHDPIYKMLDKQFTDKRICALTKTMIEPFGSQSVGIGSQVSQIIAVSYRNPIDRIVKQKMRAKYYACYMDDSYIIHSNKQFLWACLQEIQAECEKLGIKLNTRKTQIVKLSHGFTYMKNTYYLTKSGKVIVKPCKKNTTRERRKLKKFKLLYDNGKIGIDDVLCNLNSYLGHIKKDYNSYRTQTEMKILFHKLFGNIPINRKEL